jgi:hypothetical protein
MVVGNLLIFKRLLDCVAVPHFAGWLARQRRAYALKRELKLEMNLGTIYYTASMDAIIPQFLLDFSVKKVNF